MTFLTPRRIALTAVVAAGLVAAVVFGVSYAASSRLSGERIADDLSEWSGLQVSIADQPQITFWPDLRASLANVVLSAPDNGVAIRAERVEFELSAIAALRGNVHFTKARFVNPVVSLAEGVGPAAVRGRLAHALEAARLAVASNRMAPDRSALPSDDFGVVEFVNASVVGTSGDTQTEIASELNGKVTWEKLNGRAKASLGGLLRGEQFSLDLSSANPLLLLGGADTPMTLMLKSSPANLSFDGTASLGNDPYAAGKASFSTPSAALLSEWLGTPSAAGASLGAIALEGRVRLDPTRLRMEEAAFTLGDRPARGVVDLLLHGRRPKLTGSLAFDTLDMGTFVSAFTPFDPPEGDGASGIDGGMDAGLASRLDMDLRLSARQASIGSIVMTDVAASARTDETLAAFDISDASVFGGDLQAGLRLDRKSQGNLIELRVLASDISGEAFGKAIGMNSIMPGGSSDVSLIMKGEGDSWRSIMNNASGSLSASVGPGKLPLVSLESFIAKVKAGASFPAQEVASNGSTVEGLEIKAVVAGGVVRVERLEMRTQSQRILLSGSVMMDGQGVELAGKLETPQQMAGGGEPSLETTFRIEGPLQEATVIPDAAPAAP